MIITISKKAGFQFIVTITHPRKDVPIGQLKDISKKSGIKF
nr:MAG TPA: HICA protein [Caudoviricetes sp.]DAK90241.1 MAG TPA: HICA protein [Caudoviricetes sp.]DAZ24357.1 MAG TPA: HICA protein [Caudoviricetes sp.]